ncbi:MAG: pyruvate, phosphate dikinase [Bacillati bacterium ANGP1]|uniref:Pyruvate, phosphate dikinase n=1 Tax=Candidatus Segetimicrobium genomatis TaxID=2569760 RepID=A0A537KDK2_9BACT|nr:MAG: pyruvate, phosphate dikinase [Terrabacteria group bacterium ANGP1]
MATHTSRRPAGRRAAARRSPGRPAGARAARKRIWLFDEGNATMRDLLGGKGAGLAEMSRVGLPVPPGFTITTAVCNEYNARGRTFPPGLMDEVRRALAAVERKMRKRFGDPKNPLLVSVRSGAKFSMPGMMDTVLNLGLNEETLRGLAGLTGDERFAQDAYRRFIQMFGKIVLDVEGGKFEQIIEARKRRAGATVDTDLTARDLVEIAREFKALIKREKAVDFPTDPWVQLEMAIRAVFDSWMGQRAVDYRNYNKIPHDLGTAVNVQAMVFGNMGGESATGVAFTRNPATGERRLYGEYLPNAQGEDVVAGIRTPHPIAQMERELPGVYRQFQDVATMLERHYRDMQDLEFTVERGKLWMLQTRAGKRTAQAAVKAAVDMVAEKLITKDEALLRVEPEQIYQLLLPRFDPDDKAAAEREGKLLTRGLNASPGAATGAAVFDPDTAVEIGGNGKPVILVRPETNPDDVHGMLVARGILTARGGATSHAAVVARGLGKPCVAGAEAIRVDPQAKQFSVDGRVVHQGEFISIDGTTGEVFGRAIRTLDPDLSKERDLQTLLGWADRARRLGVWANADYPRDAARAREFGAEGVGLCRTEHMFFEEDRLPIVRRMILAESDVERQRALDQLLPIQRGDFTGILREMAGATVVIRLIDPPLHEFLPRYDELLVEVTELRVRGDDPRALAEKERLLRAVAGMREQNPMLGLRGIRLGILFPGIIDMQVRAILEAACTLARQGIKSHPEIMIPLVGHPNELRVVEERLRPLAERVMAEQGVRVGYKFGTMIEVPRACVVADEIAGRAEFFSFGSNDLTQLIYGFSRDDAEGKFLLRYVNEKILPENPFQVLDARGVGALMEMAVRLGRKTRPDIELGICGEHGGDPASIEFCHKIGLTYVSCSPYRVPTARLAAAQAALKEKQARAERDR